MRSPGNPERSRALLAMAGAAALGAGILAGVRLGAAANHGRDHAVAEGRTLFGAHCAICHGERGDGRGAAAHMLAEAPRDLRSGLFKFRSTPTGALPTDADLLRTLTEGIRWTGMVARPDLSEGDRLALVAYLETLVPADHRVPFAAVLGEERAGWMILRMGRGMHGVHRMGAVMLGRGQACHPGGPRGERLPAGSAFGSRRNARQ